MATGELRLDVECRVTKWFYFLRVICFMRLSFIIKMMMNISIANIYINNKKYKPIKLKEIV